MKDNRLGCGNEGQDGERKVSRMQISICDYGNDGRKNVKRGKDGGKEGRRKK